MGIYRVPMNAGPSMASDLDMLQGKVREFTIARGWQATHSVKNLVLALTGEVGELAELIQWISDDNLRSEWRDTEITERMRDELADIFWYLLRLSDVTGISLKSALLQKLETNEERFPLR